MCVPKQTKHQIFHCWQTLKLIRGKDHLFRGLMRMHEEYCYGVQNWKPDISDDDG